MTDREFRLVVGPSQYEGEEIVAAPSLEEMEEFIEEMRGRGGGRSW